MDLILVIVSCFCSLEAEVIGDIADGGNLIVQPRTEAATPEGPLSWSRLSHAHLESTMPISALSEEDLRFMRRACRFGLC